MHPEWLIPRELPGDGRELSAGLHQYVRSARSAQQVTARRAENFTGFAAQDVGWRLRRFLARNARRRHRHSHVSLTGRAGGNAWPAGKVERQRQGWTGRRLAVAIRRLPDRGPQAGCQQQRSGKHVAHAASIAAIG